MGGIQGLTRSGKSLRRSIYVRNGSPEATCSSVETINDGGQREKREVVRSFKVNIHIVASLFTTFCPEEERSNLIGRILA